MNGFNFKIDYTHEPLEKAIQIDVDVPHVVLGHPIGKALSSF